MPYEVPLVFSQADEMLDTLGGVWTHVLLPVFIILGMLVVIYFLLHNVGKWTLKGGKVSLISMIVILCLGSVVATQRSTPYVFLPKAQSTSIKNMYTVLSWSIAKEIPKILGKKNKLPHFKPYSIQDNKIKKPQTIVVIMGESLGAKYMSLYGFGKNTTPKLNKRKDSLSYTWGYSAGINTDVAVPTFFAAKREPQNNMVFLKGDTNLFTMAKNAGYKTHYITTQRLTVMGGFLGGSVDVLHSKSYFAQKGEIYDDVLVEYLKNIDVSKKNFIVLHQRNSHSPYDKYTPKEYDSFKFDKHNFKSYMQGSYYNSVLYTDTLIDNMMHILDKQKQSAVLFFTSDHGEMLGNKDEEGRFGHLFLGYADAKVPMITYTNKSAAYLKEPLNLEGVISHYQFVKKIVTMLGKDIINDNENGEFYINGVDISGSQGYITYKKRGKL
ncbi:MAG: phosphoethanolamine transferase [Sulfurovum sp.]|nr:phosphoethanolamine transferase [Sulfurovum sp.]